MKSLSLQDIRRVTGGRSTVVLPASAPMISAICTDTRAMKPDSLFIAIKGGNLDGHRYLATAAAEGAIAALISDVPKDPPRNLRLIVVPDTRIAMGKLAAFVRKALRAKVIAVAGSNGKTSTKYLIHDVLRTKCKGSCSPKSFNNDIGVPVTIFAADERDDYLVLEIGTNHPGEVRNLTEIAQPDIAVITNCSAEHLEFLGDLAGVRRENASLIEGLAAKGLLIVNGDEPELLTAVAGYAGKRISFGFKPSNDLFATDIECDGSGVRFKMNGRVPIAMPLLGRHSVANSLAAIAVAKKFLLSEEEFIRALAGAHGPEMRLQLEQIDGITLLNDAYNANPASMRAALETLKSLPTSGRRLAIIGDMRELGATSNQLHQEVGAFAAECALDRLICVGSQSRWIAETARRVGMAEENVELFANSDDVAREIPRMILSGDVVLLKGSRGIQLETVANAIKELRVASCS